MTVNISKEVLHSFLDKGFLLSPDILEVIKNGSTSNILFKRAKNSSQENTNDKSEYLIFYIDEKAPNQGIWVQRKVLCNSDKCNFKLENDTANFEEKIKFKNGNTRVNKHQLYMEDTEKILLYAQQAGFTLHSIIDLINVGYEYQFVYVFTKP